MQREDELLSSWWEEYGECSVGPKGAPNRFNSASEISSPESSQAHEDLVEEERVGVPVKGGLYEVSFVYFILFIYCLLVHRGRVLTFCTVIMTRETKIK